MKTLWVLAFLLLSFWDTSAQNTNQVWAFGWGCGLDFNTSPPTPVITRANAYEGCASISDNNGQLLMYTTGDTVYNRNHQPMPNGGNILGTAAIIGSCTQGNLIVPKPGSNTLYYVFTLQGITDGLPQGKLFYNLVDMTLDSGRGDVVPGQKLIPVTAQLGEKLTAIAGTCNNIWVIVCPQSGTEFRAYEVTAAGVNTTPVISPINTPAPGLYDVGVLKGAHNGRKLVSVNYYAGTCQLFDFDNAQGIISNPIDFIVGSISSPYGACFSPDDSKLYLPFDSIYQYDLSLGNTAAILNSKVGITPALLVTGEVCGDMQTAPDGKVYISKLNATSLAGINAPNMAGTSCGFNPVAITLPAPSKVGIGLPNTIVNPVTTGNPTVYVHDTTMCSTWTAFSSAAHGPYTWGNGDTSASIQISQPGVYWVTASSACGIIDTFRVTSAGSNLHLDDTSICNGDSIHIPITLSASATATILWNTGDTQPAIVVTDTGVYWVQITDGICVASDTMLVRYTPCGCPVTIPTAFSPNGDGLNDYFTPVYQAANCTDKESYVLQVFNRWGEEVYSGTRSQAGWDGYYKQQPADVGVYMFHLSYKDTHGERHSQKGDITLLR